MQLTVDTIEGEGAGSNTQVRITLANDNPTGGADQAWAQLVMLYPCSMPIFLLTDQVNTHVIKPRQLPPAQRSLRC